MPKLNSMALPIEKEERQGIYKVTTETEVPEIVSHYHSVEVGRPLPTKAKNMFFKNMGGKLVRSRTAKSASKT